MNKSLLSIAISSALIVGASTVSAAPPAVHNDFYQQAIPINPVPTFPEYAQEEQDTTEATVGMNPHNEKGEPAPTCAPTGHTVWYKFTASQDSTVRINTFGSTFDTVLAVYGNHPRLEQVACNDDSFVPGFGLQSRIIMDVEQGETYYILAGGYGERAGDLVLNAFYEAAP